jgi:beta-galactosidase
MGKATVTCIGVDADGSRLEKNVLRGIFHQAGAATENEPEGVYGYWRNGFHFDQQGRVL